MPWLAPIRLPEPERRRIVGDERRAAVSALIAPHVDVCGVAALMQRMARRIGWRALAGEIATVEFGLLAVGAKPGSDAGQRAVAGVDHAEHARRQRGIKILISGRSRSRSRLLRWPAVLCIVEHTAQQAPGPALFAGQAAQNKRRRIVRGVEGIEELRGLRRDQCVDIEISH